MRRFSQEPVPLLAGWAHALMNAKHPVGVTRGLRHHVQSSPSPKELNASPGSWMLSGHWPETLSLPRTLQPVLLAPTLLWGPGTSHLSPSPSTGLPQLPAFASTVL